MARQKQFGGREVNFISSVSAESLTCIRGGRLVFRDVSFSLAAGQVLALEGPNGSGKTSLLRLIAGFLPQAQGTIRVQTKESASEEREERAHLIGWLGHQDAAKAQMTPCEILRFFTKFENGAGDVDAALDAVRLARQRDLPSQYLSAGQKKRLALARLKLSNRPLWLLDEPLAALDTSGRALVADLIKAHCASGGMAIAATHEPLGLDSAHLQLGGAV